jgi:hypothetical protein
MQYVFNIILAFRGVFCASGHKVNTVRKIRGIVFVIFHCFPQRILWRVVKCEEKVSVSFWVNGYLSGMMVVRWTYSHGACAMSFMG